MPSGKIHTLTTRFLAYALGFDMLTAVALGEAAGKNDNDSSRHAPTLCKRAINPFDPYSRKDYLVDARKYHFPTDQSLLQRWDEFKAEPTLETWGNLMHNRQEWEFASHRNNQNCWHPWGGDDTRIHLRSAYNALWVTKDMIENHAPLIQDFVLNREADPITDLQICKILDPLFKSAYEGSWFEDYQRLCDGIVREIEECRVMNLHRDI